MIPKFRAWEPYKNKMNYKVMVGNCDQDDDNWTCPIIWDEERAEWVHFDDFDCIMQSTSLFDKNGVEIFEGDVVRYENTISNSKEVGIVGYFPDWGMFGLDVKKFTKPSALFFNGFGEHISLAVLGNKFENPELLEVEDA